MMSLALPMSVVIATAPATAQAARKAFTKPMLAELPGDELIGDGETAARVRLLALETDGTAMKGLSGSVSASAGKVGGLKEVAPGIYEVKWTPPRVESSREVEFTFKGRTGNKADIDHSWTVQVVPTRARQITLKTEKTELVLGVDTTASVEISLPGGAERAPDPADLVFRVSSGRIEGVTALGGGRYKATFKAPDQRFPHLAVITVADRRDPASSWGHLTLSLVGKAKFPVTGLPGSDVRIRIDEREFGPVRADANGRAQVPIIVPPGVEKATSISVLDGRAHEEQIDLQVPPSQRARLMPLHQSIPGDTGVQVPIRAVVYIPKGGSAPTVSFSVSAGAISKAVHEGDGVYRAVFTPPRATSAADVSVQITARSGGRTYNDSQRVELLPAAPASIGLRSDPASLGKGGGSFKAYAKVTGRGGVALSGADLLIHSDHARLKGTPRDLGGGDYQATFSGATGSADVVGVVRGAVSGNPLHGVRLIAVRDAVPADGETSTTLVVLTHDVFGYPVPATPVVLRVAKGDGSVKANLITDDSGIAFVPYTAGTTAGAVQIVAQVQDAQRTVNLLQLPGGGDIPLSATTTAAGERDGAWAAGVGVLHVASEGGGGAVVAASPAGPVTKISMAAPASVSAGGTVTLQVIAQDAQGRGKTGETLEFMVSTGDLSAVQDLGGGRYSTTLTVPAGTTEEIKVSVASAETGAAAFAKIPIGASSAWGAVAVDPTPTAIEEPVKEEKPPKEKTEKPPREKKEKEPREKKPAGEHPIARASLGYLGGFYSYQQKPATSTGPLYPQTITVGGGATAPGATAGFAIGGRMWMPFLEYVGAEVGYRTSFWSMQLDAGFDEPIVDGLHNAALTGIGRYPLDIGTHRIHAGARVGYVFNDFLYYAIESTDEGATQLTYYQLPVSSLGVGGELGVELDFGLFAVFVFDAGLSDGLGLFSTEGRGELGYAFTDSLFARVGGGWMQRSTDVYPSADSSGDSVGTLSDLHTMFSAGVGWQR